MYNDTVFGSAGLTTQERRVAMAVGGGASNKAAARDLTVSIKTIEFHLGNVYRKLGIGSRAELANLVGSRLQSAGPFSVAGGGNLPTERSALVGRDAELARLVAMVRSNRHVTVTGPGGVGKTRLALAAAAAEAVMFEDGAWMIDLGSVAVGGDVAAACADALGLRQRSMATADDIADALRGQRRLIVVDNCEHVIAEAALVANAIARQCAGVSVLATSRERLDIADEAVFALAPMTVEDTDGGPSEAARLFAARAAAVLGGYAPDARDGDVVTSICRHLDGLPLAIELAAARLGVLSLDDVHERLDDRFRLLTRRHDSDHRHQSLLATIQWSYDLLDQNEQRVFETLSVFVGDFDLASAVAVAGDASEDAIISLVDKSLLVMADGPTGRRYRMLETVREYAHGRLAARGGVDAARQRHLDRFVVFVAEANHGVRGADELRWHRALLADWHNVRAAVATACENDDGRSACRLVEETLWWIVTRLRGDADEWVQRVNQLPSIATLPERPIITIAAAFLSSLRGDSGSARDLLARARSEELELGRLREPWIPATAVFVIDPSEVLAETANTIERAQEGGSLFWEVLGVLQEALIHHFMINLTSPTAEELDFRTRRIRDALRLAEQLGNPNGVAYGMFISGGVLLGSDPEQMETLLQRSLDMAHPLGLELLCGQIRTSLATLYLHTGRRHRAVGVLADSLRGHLGSGATFELPRDLAGCATHLVDIGQHELAVVALGAVHSVGASVAEWYPIAGLDAKLEDELGEQAYAELYERGRQAGLPEVAREMLEVIERLPPEAFERATIGA